MGGTRRGGGFLMDRTHWIVILAAIAYAVFVVLSAVWFILARPI